MYLPYLLQHFNLLAPATLIQMKKAPFPPAWFRSRCIQCSSFICGKPKSHLFALLLFNLSGKKPLRFLCWNLIIILHLYAHQRKRRRMKTSPGLGRLQELGLKEGLGWQPGHRSLVVQLVPAECRPHFPPCFTACGLMRKQLV